MNISYGLNALKTIQSNFSHELQDAYSGKKTSLPFIIHMLSSLPIIQSGEVFEVLVIGGSVWKKAFLQKTKTGIEIIKKEIEQFVIFKNERDFLEFIYKELDQNANVLALNFAYPLKPVFENNKLDGVLLAITKEGKFKGLVGKHIGKEIGTYVLTKRNKRIKVSVANDTICLLLSGLTKYNFNKLADGIVGTGLNFAFFLDKAKSVNLESANFDRLPQSSEGKIVDQESDQSGKAIFEKETAGAYLYKHFNLIIKNKKIDFSPIGSTEELNNITLKQIPQVSEIAQDLLKRSAQLVACQIAGIVLFRQHDMVFNMERSLFWKGNEYKEMVEKFVKQLVPKYKVRFIEIKDSAILGAAKLVA